MNNLKSSAIFIGHGSPLTILTDNAFKQAWQKLGMQLEKPQAVLVISAHWYIGETAVSDVSEPSQIYDFYGFPEELYALKYNPPGSAAVAKLIQETLVSVLDVKINNEWGIDHGAWTPLKALFPLADVPVLQLSLNHNLPAAKHYQIAQALKPLRDQGILIIGSGDMVHNLGVMSYEETAAPFAWAQKFEQHIIDLIASHDHQALMAYSSIGPEAKLAIPTPEHYLPLLYILALQEEDDKLRYFVEGITHGSISMTSFILEQ